ncbi:conserved hypothetical protein, secreted [Candidatus Magnetomorum sp. HK-1]|nr:conserved hypothetical protein, secreted [Candidatus Magnetomorum sp. HK-1]
MKRSLFNKKLCVLLCFCSISLLFSMALAQTRIVVIPFYEENNQTTKDNMKRHYRRISGFINNHLVSKEFEVVNPFAVGWKEVEFNLLLKSSRNDSAFVCKEMCRKYSSDIAYILWIDLKKTITPDNFCKIKVSLEGQGYDSASRDVGVYIAENIQSISTDCDDAIIDSEKKIAILTGKKLVSQLQIKNSFTENIINIRLEGNISPELAEIFGKIINVTRGISEAKNYRFKIHSTSVWRVLVSETELFRLNTNITRLIKQIVTSKGIFEKNGVLFHYDAKEIDSLKRIKCKDTSSREILFVLDK